LDVFMTARQGHLFAAKVFLNELAIHRRATTWSHSWWEIFAAAQAARRQAANGTGCPSARN
jgi:hypothetical protein